MAAFALPSTGTELLATWAGHALLLWTFGLLFGWLVSPDRCAARIRCRAATGTATDGLGRWLNSLTC
jgi:hypothetical protein